MTTQPVEANVVLTADNTQYDQAMDQSSQSTANLGKVVDTLGQKISNLTKAAGKTLIGISAADVALIGSATAAWASYEKQVSRLQAQSAILTRTNASQERVMKDYTTAIKGLRTEYGTTTAEAAKLVETLGKVTSTRQTRDLTDLSKVFVDMSKATGESSEGLAGSLTNLQKVMGTPVNARNTRQYADMFTYLAAQTQTSTTGLIDFTAQIAPMAEQMGMNTKEVAGFATAFAKAGQEGFAAGNVFNKVTGDITKAIASGGPELKQYANIVGVTAESFSKMDAAEQVLRVFEALQKQGDQAVVTLERLGLEGPRSMRAIAAVSREPGGMRAALGMAEVGAASDASAKGAAAAMDNLSSKFEELREELKMTAESLATIFGPVVTSVVSGMEKIAENVNQVMSGPFGEMVQVIMGLVATVAGGVGPMLLFAGAILKVAAAFALWRNSMMLGAREGFAGGGRIGGAAPLMTGGRQLAEGGSWGQRMLYNMGQPAGAAVGGGLGLMREGYLRGRTYVDPGYQQGPSRGPLSYLAGGLARGIDMFGTPQFEQMAHVNPARREQMLGRAMPWAGLQDQARLAGQIGAVGLAMTGLTTARGVEESVMGAQGASPEMQARVKRETEEAQQRLNTAKEAAQATRDSINATREQSKGVRDNDAAHRSLTRSMLGFGAGMVGGAAGGVRAGAGALMRTGMAGNIIGGLGTAGMAAAGVESNMMMFGAMGTAIMPGYGTAAGAVLGAGLDMAKANDKATDSVKALNEAASETMKSGAGLAGMDELTQQTKDDIDELQKGFDRVKDPGFMGYQELLHPTEAFGGAKNWVEGIFGSSDIEELERDGERAQGTFKATEEAVRALAEASGVDITGTRRQQLAKLEEFMSTEGAQKLETAGVDLETVVAKHAVLSAFGLGGADSDYMKQLAFGMDESLEARLKAMGGVGAAMVTQPTARRALVEEGDIALLYRAVNEVFDTAVSSGESYLQIMKEAETAQQEIGIENSRSYEFQMALAGKAEQALAMRAPQLGRVGTFQQTLRIGTMLQGITPETAEQAQQLEERKTMSLQAVGDMMAYFRQMLLAQDQYELSRARAQEDYHTLRMNQEYDFNLSRERAEESFDRMRGRATADFARGQARAHYQFNLQRERAEEDFNHQVAIQAKQAAQSVYDIYQRVQAERTSSAEWILANAMDQVERMQEQAANLDELRARGLSDTAIQQLGLGDPQNAQQLARFLTEVTPQMIAQFNQVAGTERIKAAREIVTDPSSLEWAEMERGFRKSMGRGAEDFELAMKESKEDFHRGLRQQRKDFNIMMTQQQEDYDHGLVVQEKAYKKSMDRAAEDMANMANEILLTNEQVLELSMTNLTGSAQKQARHVHRSLKNLSESVKPEAIAFMTEVSSIYGFQYTIPKGAMPGLVGAAAETAADTVAGALPNYAQGGVMPGWSPGRDDRMVAVSGGEAIMRPEWTRAVGEKNVEAMNHQARYGGFAQGGIPAEGTWTQHPVSQYPWARWAGDINIPGPGDYGNPVRAWKSGVVSDVIYLGDRSYGRYIKVNHPDSNEQTLYAHLSGASVKGGDPVTRGQQIGAVGDLGNATGPHLHFEIKGGTGAINLGSATGLLGQVAASAQAAALLKDTYPGPEQAAWDMTGIHPLNPGMISTLINRFGRKKLRQLRRMMGSGSDLGLSDTPEGIPPEADDLTTNQDTVQRAMLAAGYGMGQWSSLYQLVMHESGFNNKAQNPTSSAYGMFQFLDSTWAGVDGKKTSDPWLQSIYGMRYIRERYRNPKHAWAFWEKNNWYGDGAVFDGPQTIGVGENGPEAVIPLNARGGEFMADVMARSVGMGSTPTGGGLSVYNTRVDRSTNFSGPITVQANNPEELITKLQQRQRVMALSRPSLTGSAA